MTASPAPAAMPSEEEIQFVLAQPLKDDDWVVEKARAVLGLFAPILAEKQKPTVALNHWKARALAAEAALTEIRARHAEWRKCMPADWEGDPLSHAIEAAAIRAQGE